MTIDTKHQVLYALYSEYQKDIPDMESINAAVLDMEVPVFNAALLKLQNEGYIQGFDWRPPETMDARKIISSYRKNIYLTRKGVEYVEKLASIAESMPARKKIAELAKQVGLFGMDILKSFILSQIT
ncbi:YjcQ family protein [Massiliimalia timonensis]|jgi:hypothetical protein|uniref:Uncharacterized protein n=1 Tax=Massiliimalia timonensis TaxID=1987501 RepID=A0A8J6TY42_9FIRM|nr:YjcQ family protein [Massiliimalia timonensis]MBC8612055.1 hypothetical protein [Massiliimalia timonensis]MBS7174624.1 hypothetical protein [Clostridiales bacterium]